MSQQHRVEDTRHAHGTQDKVAVHSQLGLGMGIATILTVLLLLLIHFEEEMNVHKLRKQTA